MFKQEGDFEKLCLKLTYQFRNKELLAQAITTRAAWRSNLQKSIIGHHEEMAFLGDGILRMVVDNILMEEFPYYKVGDLSKVRDLLVKNANLSEAAKRLELEKFIFMDINQAKQCQQGNPKLLADTVEAIIYAIYKDSGENLQEVKKFIFTHSSIDNALEQQRNDEEQRYRPILFAIQDGNVEQVQKMLEEGFPPNFIFRETEVKEHVQDFIWDPIEAVEHEILLTPLEEALNCLEEHPENMLRIIECLLKHGANLNLHAKENTAVISQLFSSRNYDYSQQAEFYFTRYQEYKNNKQDLEKYLSHRNKTPEQVLISWWEKTTDQIVEMFCRYGVKLDEENYLQKNTLLELAIINKQQYKIDLLLKYKINPNTQNRFGETPLHLAALFADELLAIKLLNANADPAIVDKKGSKPFDAASTPELKKLLLKAEIKHTPKLSNLEVNVEEIKQTAMNHYKKWSTQKSPEELVQATQLFTLVLKQKLHKTNYPDMSLIYDFYNLGSAYFQRHNYEKAKPLLERAYILYLINEQQFQPKTNKYLERLNECEKQLIEQNKPAERVTATVSDIVKPTGLPSQFKSIAMLPGDKQLNDNKFEQKLFSAIGMNSTNLVESSLKSGANPEAVSEKGEPVLHYAIQQYVRAVLRVKVINNPYLMRAFDKRHALQIIEMLLAFGADPNQRDAKGRTALHIAAIVDDELDIDNKSNIISLLLKHGVDSNIRDHDNNFASHYAKESDTKHLILNALLPAQSTKEVISSFKEKSPQAKEISSQKFFTVKTESQENKTKIAEAKEPKRNDIDKKPQINTVQNTSAKSLLANNIKKKQHKTALCKFFKEGNPDTCSRGNQCKFAHSTAELKM